MYHAAMRFFLHDGHPDDGWIPGMDPVGGRPVSQYQPRLGAIILARLSRTPSTAT